MNKSEIFIYALKLSNEKYYVGQTINVDDRISQHLKGNQGSEWTKTNPPVELIEKIPTNFTKTEDAMFLENSITLKYMSLFGWKNVRGGDFCTLDEDKLRFLLCNNSNLGSEILPLKVNVPFSLNSHGIFIFILKLVDNRFYVGKTKNLKIGVLKECNGKGSEWTIKYKAIELIGVIDIKSLPIEKHKEKLNEVTIDLMRNHGYNKVRGGDYYRVDSFDHLKKVKSNTDLLDEKL